MLFEAVNMPWVTASARVCTPSSYGRTMRVPRDVSPAALVQRERDVRAGACARLARAAAPQECHRQEGHTSIRVGQYPTRRNERMGCQPSSQKVEGIPQAGHHTTEMTSSVLVQWIVCFIYNLFS